MCTVHVDSCERMCFSILTQYIVACDHVAFDVNNDKNIPRVDDLPDSSGARGRERDQYFLCHRYTLRPPDQLAQQPMKPCTG